MKNLILLAVAGFISMNTFAEGRKIAFVMGGAAHNEKNEFLESMVQQTRQLQQRGWDVHVLYDSSKYKSDWRMFPKNSQPAVFGEESHQFTMDNYDKTMQIINDQSLQAGDQVEVQIEGHGEVHSLLGHIIEWRDANANSLVEYAHTLWNRQRTSNMTPQIEELLKKGVRVHVDIFSCYSGAAFESFSDLLAKYPDLLCITTTASSDREAVIDGTFPSLMPKKKSKPTSVWTGFRNYKLATAQISAAPDWMTAYENIPDPLTAASICPYCDLKKVDSLAEHSAKELAKFAGEDHNPSLAELQRKCSDRNQERLVDALKDAYGKLDDQYADVKIPIKLNEHNVLVQFDPGGMGFYVGRQGYSIFSDEFIRITTDQDPVLDISVAEMVLNLDWNINSMRAKLIKKEFRKILKAAPPEFQAAVAKFKAEYDRLNKSLLVQVCNQRQFETALVKTRASYLSKLGAQAKLNPDSIEAKKISACENFKY
jgi:hypothetical protein